NEDPWVRAVLPAVQLPVRVPCSGQPPAADVFVHDVVEEKGIEMVPLEPRRGVGDDRFCRATAQALVTGYRECEAIPLPREQDSRVPVQGAGRGEPRLPMLPQVRPELAPNLLVGAIAVRGDEPLEAGQGGERHALTPSRGRSSPRLDDSRYSEPPAALGGSRPRRGTWRP